MGGKEVRPMSSEARALLTLGADVGGKDAHTATHEHVLSLRRLLQQKCLGPYGATVKEFALVLRIDGSVKAWGKSGADNAAFQRRGSFATVDIFLPESAWSGREAASIRKVLAVGVVAAIETLTELSEQKRIDISIDRLRQDVAAVVEEYLTCPAQL
jgi:hypothetical protein